MPQPLLTQDAYFLLPHSLSQWIFYEIHAGNAALSCLLRFPESYTTCFHKNLNVLEIGRSVVLIMLRLPQDRMSCLVKSNTVENTNNTVIRVISHLSSSLWSSIYLYQVTIKFSNGLKSY
ncbi:hypothetical protein T08_2940 [Trichinella sp. T8]|nr:hypothetical protein T08_2940 [Trichinella sp. T8]